VGGSPQAPQSCSSTPQNRNETAGNAADVRAPWACPEAMRSAFLKRHPSTLDSRFDGYAFCSDYRIKGFLHNAALSQRTELECTRCVERVHPV